MLATIAPLSITMPRPSLFVVDFGERRAGVVQLKGWQCATGSTIVLRHAEILQHAALPDLHGHFDPSMIYTGNLRSAKATVLCTCRDLAS